MNNDLEEIIGGFDADAVEPTTDFAAMPPGDYDVVITESEIKPTKNGQGKYLELRLEVQKGEFSNRVLWDRLNLVNASDKAVEIAKGTLSAICRAVGVLSPKDSSELHSRPLVAVVKTRMYDGTIQNEVRGYKPAAVASKAKARDVAAKKEVERREDEDGDEVPF